MMKGLTAFLFALLFLAGCGDDDSGPSSAGDGLARIKVEAFDSPPPLEVEHVYLTIEEVSVHSDETGWVVLAEPDATFDFLELVNGATAALVDTTLEPGSYSQMRLVVAETNEVVVGGQRENLKVPSGAQSGVKLNLHFDVEPDELIEILVDFDVAKSIKWTPKNYQLNPTFKAFKKVISGTLAGTVRDPAGTGVRNALVEATSGDETIATLTDSTGAYKLILPEGPYGLQATAEGYTTADTTYADVLVNAGGQLTGYDFVLRP